jgi:hypothetical protein
MLGLGAPESRGPVRFAQTSYSKTFSRFGRGFYSNAAGRAINTVGDLTQALLDRVIGPQSLPVEYVMVEGQMVVLNTRTSAALMDAKVKVKDWNLVDVTGNDRAMRAYRNQIKGSGLAPTGTRIRPQQR